MPKYSLETIKNIKVEKIVALAILEHYGFFTYDEKISQKRGKDIFWDEKNDQLISFKPKYDLTDLETLFSLVAFRHLRESLNLKKQTKAMIKKKHNELINELKKINY